MGIGQKSLKDGVVMSFPQPFFDPPERQFPDKYVEQEGCDALAQRKIDPERLSEIDPAGITKKPGEQNKPHAHYRFLKNPGLFTLLLADRFSNPIRNSSSKTFVVKKR